MDNFTTALNCAIAQHQMIKNGDTVIVACSGGADSVALFHFLFVQQASLGITLRAAHVNHALRGAQSDADAAFVAQLCARYEVPLDTLRLSPPPAPGEAWAREQRYAFFDQLAQQYSAKIATAHTKNDHAETVLFHLARGTGVHGAAGIPPMRGAVIRPMLGVQRCEVEAYLQQNGLTHITDTTNTTDVYARNRVRHHVLPALETVHAGTVQTLTRFAADMAETAAYLDAQAKVLLEQAMRVCPLTQETAYTAHVLAAAPAPVRKAALRLLMLPWADPASATLALADAALAKGGSVQLSAQSVLCISQGLVRIITPQMPPQTAWEVPFSLGEVTLPHGMTVTVCTQSYEEFIKFQKQEPTPLKLWGDYGKMVGNAVFRTRRTKDIFAEAGRGVSKTLKKLYSEEKLSPQARNTLPVLASEHTILWAAGFGFAQSVIPDQTTQTLVTITLQNGGTQNDAREHAGRYP